jgi:hypothetical protein
MAAQVERIFSDIRSKWVFLVMRFLRFLHLLLVVAEGGEHARRGRG